MSCTDTNTINTSHTSSMSDLSVPSKMREAGLSTSQAMEQFSNIVRSTVHACTAHSKPIPRSAKVLFSLQSLLLFTIVLLVYHDCGDTDPKHVLILKLSVVLVVGLGELYGVVAGEHHEVGRKLGLAGQVQKCLLRTQKAVQSGITYGMPPRVPILGKHKFVRVYRDGKLQLCPATLLVAGDVIQLLEGEPEPCRVKPAVSAIMNCAKECIVLESPIVRLIESHILDGANIGRAERPSHYRALMTLCLMVAPAWCHKGFIQRGDLHKLIITLLVLRSGVYGLVLRAWTCARLQLVAEALKRSKTPYDESLDTDEFDEEAPPPSKEIVIKPSLIVKRLLHNLMAHHKDIVELVGNMSVICFTDREGPISVPLPSPDDLVVVQAGERGVVCCRAGVEEWSLDAHKFTRLCHHQPDYQRLKPLGLATLTCSLCTGSPHPHRRFALPEEYRRYITSVAMQACQCAVGRSMGVEPVHRERLELVDLQWFCGHPTSGSGESGKQDPVIVFTYKDKLVEGVLRSFAVGPLPVLLACCTEYYVDGSIIDMTPSVRRALLESEEGSVGRDEECIGYAHQTIMQSSPPDHPLATQEHYCFLGSITCSPKAREDMQEFIDDVMNAGIRFVYLGEEGERQCKTFGSRLGLDTDWNGCILLSADDQANYTDPSDIKARLPVGVQQIREHLKHVDDIPLHVSVFAECRGDAGEMVKIYKDHGETVAVAVSALHPDHHALAHQADLCIAMEPTVVGGEQGKRMVWEVACDWHTLSASLRLSFDSSPYIITDLVKEGRTLRRARGSAYLFFQYGTILCLLGAGQMLTHMCIVITLSIVINAAVLYDGDVLRLMPEKSSELDVADVRDRSCGWLVAMLCAHFVTPDAIPHTLLYMFMVSLHPVKPVQQIVKEHHQKHPILVSSLAVLLLAVVAGRPIWGMLAVPPMVAHEAGKWMFKERYWESQKRSKLEFSTRLGMHSPI